jgi:hypothetical protein
MIKSFDEFLNESLSYSKMMRLNMDEFISGGIEEIGKQVLQFLDGDKCLLVDENGDEDEFEVYNRIKSLAENAAVSFAKVSYPVPRIISKSYETTHYDFAHVIYYEKFTGIGKLVSITRGQSATKAKASEEYMFFLPLTFRPQKFMESTTGAQTGKKFGL